MDITITAQKPVSELLSCAQELITEVQEWANVLWVRVVGCRPRFISKKVIKVVAIVEDEDFYYRQAQAVKSQLQDANEIPLSGSPKQVAWAERIRNQALESIAIQVCEKEITEQQAWEILKTPSASWWIDNRGEWIDINYKGVY